MGQEGSALLTLNEIQTGQDRPGNLWAAKKVADSVSIGTGRGRGQYVRVGKRQLDGGWRTAIDMTAPDDHSSD